MKHRILLRKINSKLNKLLNNIKFRIEAFSFWKIVVLSWVLFGFLSFFFNYIDSNNPLFKMNIFWKITFFSWIIISISFLIILFLIFSFNKKEKIKKQINILFRDYIIILFLSIIIFLLALNNFFVIKWLIIFSSEIFIWNWVIIHFISWIIIFIWSLILKNEYDSSKSTFIQDNTIDETTNKETNNTKLPF